MYKLKKIASALASALMVGSTVGLAAAANYPAPFVSGGVADVAIVYSSAYPSTPDLAAVLDVQADLNTYVTSTGGDDTVTGGDFVKLEKASTKFQLGNGMLDVVSSAITDDDLEVLLADGVYLDNDNDEFDYTQKLTLTNQSLTMFDDNDYKEDTPTVGFKVSSSANVLNYTLDFSDEPYWTDLTQTDIEIMGKEYFILSMTNITTLNLLDSASTTILTEGETATVGTHEVSIAYVGSTDVKFNVNGATTNSLSEGQTQKLADGSYIGVKDILYVSKDTGVSSVEFSIGSGKMQLTEGQDIKMNDDSINGLTVDFTNSADGKLQKMIIAWGADDDVFIAEDSSITMPGFENIKLSYTGMTYPAEETFTVQGGSTSYAQLNDFPTKDSVDDINLLYGASSAWTGIGKDSTGTLRTSNNSAIVFDGDTDDMFIASYNDGTNAESYLVKATSFSTENSVNKTTIQYRKDGAWVDKKADVEPTDTVILGNVILTAGYIDKNAKTINMTINSNGNFNRVYSKEGLQVWLPWDTLNQTNSTEPGAITFLNPTSTSGNRTYFPLVFEEEDKNENIGGGRNFNVTLTWNSDGEAQVGDIVGEDVTFAEQGNTDIFRSFIYSALATEFLWDQGSGTSDQDSVSITYHGAESYASVFLTDVSATVGSSGGLSVAVTDAEASAYAGKNLVVVGGSCVNTVAASLLGVTYPTCGADWATTTGVNANQYLIQSFDKSGKVATLVAGYNAGDTSNAATALTTQTVDTTVGKKYTGTTVDSLVPVVA